MCWPVGWYRWQLMRINLSLLYILSIGSSRTRHRNSSRSISMWVDIHLQPSIARQLTLAVCLGKACANLAIDPWACSKACIDVSLSCVTSRPYANLDTQFDQYSLERTGNDTGTDLLPMFWIAKKAFFALLIFLLMTQTQCPQLAGCPYVLQPF